MNLTEEYLNLDMEQAKRISPMLNCLIWTDEPINLVEFDQKVKIRIFFEAYEQKILSVNFNLMDDKKNNITGSNLLLAGEPVLEVRPGIVSRWIIPLNFL